MPRIETDSGILLVCDVCDKKLDEMSDYIYSVPGVPESILCEKDYKYYQLGRGFGLI